MLIFTKIISIQYYIVTYLKLKYYAVYQQVCIYLCNIKSV